MRAHCPIGWLLVAFTLWPLAASADIIETVPEMLDEPPRLHRVTPGGTTTFLVLISHPVSRSNQVTVEIDDVPAGFQTGLSPVDERFAPVRPLHDAWPRQLEVETRWTRPVRLLVKLRAPADAELGKVARVDIAARGGGRSDRVECGALIDRRPKIYFVAMDSLGRNNLRLNAAGTALRPLAKLESSTDDDWLMLETQRFLRESAHWTEARALLPSATDMNHLAALSGCYPGTLGIQSVAAYYLGENRLGRAVISPPRHWMLRYGSEGEPVTLLYDQMWQEPGSAFPTPPAVSHPQRPLGAFVAGKEWVSGLIDEMAARQVGGRSRPAYLPAPDFYRLGDPPSDPNPSDDDARTLVARAMGLVPIFFPDDQWVSDSAIRLVWAEDPDVSYVLLAGCDDTFHVLGSAHDPDEWDDRGTPGDLSDDVHRYNPLASREAAVDAVREADRCFGRFLDTLRARGQCEDSIIVLLSDHGAVTHRPRAFDLGRILDDAGLGSSVETVMGASGVAMVFLREEDRAVDAERALEAFDVQLDGRTVQPFTVLTREEMRNGWDDVVGKIGEAKASGGSELYSVWCAEDEVTPRVLLPLAAQLRQDELGRVRWPHLLVFFNHGFQAAASGGNLGLPAGSEVPIVGGHGGPDTADIVLAMKAPNFEAGQYEQTATPADLTPTVFRLMGWEALPQFDGRVLDEAMSD